MIIKNFYIVPENKIDELFAEENINFLLDLFFKRIDNVKDKETYKEVVHNKFKCWLDTKGIKYG